MPAVLLVCPTMWDEAELPAAAARAGMHVEMYGTDVSEHPETFDALEFIDRAVREFRGRGIAGVLASDDYPGSIVAAAIARELGLPGPDPGVLLRCQHKFYSRLDQREAWRDAVPEFKLIDPRDVLDVSRQLTYPVFVKPVKSFFSVLAERVDSGAELASLAWRAGYHVREFVRPFNQLLERYTSLDWNGGYLLVEELLHGAQVTVEGFVHAGAISIVGVTDSVMYPGTMSFQRFEYPSSLPGDVLLQMRVIAESVVEAIGLDEWMFNIEMFHDPVTGRVSIIEMNPRMCPQFADLVEKVDGVNTYDMALALAAGRDPPWPWPVPGRHAVAASFALRRFEDAVVRRVPSAGELDAVRTRFPDARVKVLCREGHRLSEELQDGKSYRYAVVNVGAATRADLLEASAEIERMLGFEFTAV